jgi:NADH:ubiquinone oxidoreductase subunit D
MSALPPKADIAEHESDISAILGSLDIVFGEIDR